MQYFTWEMLIAFPFIILVSNKIINININWVLIKIALWLW